MRCLGRDRRAAYWKGKEGQVFEKGGKMFFGWMTIENGEKFVVFFLRREPKSARGGVIALERRVATRNELVIFLMSPEKRRLDLSEPR